MSKLLVCNICGDKYLARGLCRKHYDALPEMIKKRSERASYRYKTDEEFRNKRSQTTKEHEKKKTRENNLSKYGTEVHPRFLPGICKDCGKQTNPDKRYGVLCVSCYKKSLYHAKKQMENKNEIPKKVHMP